ncbi:hypothetical protein JMY81_02620 [Brenneria goodwinii]|uniref:hypothetical protein n=1 Tax=Brenneria goodwinii TaxID=1109412 RepID=UPI000EF1C17C|nr:hypothetical protein [Brenneria goodwinii]MCG8156666.1 hypothetical protein [Brenneria goodwinii]MCG8159734.1 hypothetical protein [Brenneria goodwinii]MCG8165824.1 hypothetical protein [Brenneria goodwinii]MCG8170215.1 hypothetical protein [Brenneria goodwinii]MCG8173593.1 hypothetical protein [Brenneria goodwinii]
MIHIDAMTLQQLRQRQAQRSQATAGLALVVRGDACRGWSLQMIWRDRALPGDECLEIDGLRLFASALHWQQLAQARISSDTRGIWVEFQPLGCRCESGSCA